MTSIEILREQMPVINDTVKEAGLSIQLDIGSTETRSTCRKKNSTDTTTDVLALETSHIECFGRLPFIRTSKAMEDNLEAKIKGATSDWHLLKGSICNLVSMDKSRIVSCSSKVDQQATYQSIVFNCALQAVLYSIKNNVKADVYNIDVTLSLPPEDITESRIEQLEENLLGVYTIDFPRMKTNVCIQINSVDCYAEPVAAAFGYVVERTESDNENIVFIDCGGRSKGAVLYKNKSFVTGQVVTDAGGGENYLSNVAENIAYTNNCNLPDIDTVRDAIKVGKINIGNTTVSITDDMDYAKKELAKECSKTILRLLDRCDTRLEEVQKIVCTGRSFLPTVDNGKVVSESLIEFLKETLKFSGVSLTFERYQKNNPIISGLGYYYTMSTFNK